MPSDRPPLPHPIGRPLATLYALGVRVRNARYDRGIAVAPPPLPVISVGNISVGGVGKTPMVQRLARLLLSRGHTPAIVLRGYKAGAGQMSDEEAEHRAALPGVSVVANPDRIAAAQSLAERNGDTRPTCVILDDGFQHRRLGRTLDLVLIDARRSPWDDAVLPAGWLREPPESLARADAIALTHADLTAPERLEELCRRIRDVHGKPPVAMTKHAWSELLVESARAEPMTRDPTGWLHGRRVVVCCAIGEPDQFLRMVGDSGATIVDRLVLRDHAPFDRKRVEQLTAKLDSSRGDAMVCTAKDWPRLAPVVPEGFDGPIAYPVVSIEAISGGEALDGMILDAAGPPRTQE